MTMLTAVESSQQTRPTNERERILTVGPRVAVGRVHEAVADLPCLLACQDVVQVKVKLAKLAAIVACRDGQDPRFKRSR